MSFFFRSKFKSQNLYNPGASGGLKYISPEERLEEENKANKKKVDKRSFCYTNNQGN
jgi:hypothetical protein